jgi:hypothetical protein
MSNVCAWRSAWQGAALRDEFLQRAHVHLSKIKSPDHRVEHLQLHTIVADAFLLCVVL